MNIDIKENKIAFCSLLNSIERDGAQVDKLIHKLESSDFFEAPASSKYHNSEEGGLVDHSLKVYNNLVSLVKMKGLDNVIPKDSIIICGLLHDMSKMNLYEKYYANKKVYSDSGSKFDNIGKFDWQAVEAYRTRDDNDRFIYGSHEETSEYMVSTFIPLTVDESVAIMNHHNGISWDSKKAVSGCLYARYPLACLLHVADIMSTYIDEER